MDFFVDSRNSNRFRCSMKNYSRVVYHQKQHPNCLDLVLVDMITSVHRINGVWIDLSPKPIVLQSTDDYQRIGIKRILDYQTGNRHYLDDIEIIKGFEDIKNAILKNFGMHGPKYPIPATVTFEYLDKLRDRDVAKKAFEGPPFRVSLDPLLKKPELAQASHAILITGVDVMSEDESLHSVEFKYSWGSKWGEVGYTKVTFDFFKDSTIFVPVLDIQDRKRILRLCINVLVGHKIKHICFSADGRHLATASDDGVRIFQLDDASSKSFNCVKLQMPPKTSPTALCYADLSFVVATTTDMGKTKKASLYMIVEDDTNTKTFCTKWHKEKVDPIEKLLGAELNGTTVLVTSADAKGLNMRVWYGRFGKELCKMKVILTHAKNNVMAISPSGRYIAAAATHDNKVKVRELKDGKNCPTKSESSTQAEEDLGTPLAFTLGSHEDEVTGICFTPDSQRIITASKGGFLRVWLISDSGPKIIDTPIKLITYSPQDFTDTKYYDHLSISPDGKMLAVAGASLLRWISVESWNLLETVGRAHYGNIKCLAWAPARIRVGDKHDFVLATVGENEVEDSVKLWAAPSDT